MLILLYDDRGNEYIGNKTSKDLASEFERNTDGEILAIMLMIV